MVGSLSLSQVLALGVVVLGSLLTAVALVTVGYSLRAARRRRRREPLRATLRSGLLERLYGRDDPAWDEWVAGLSAAERDELESLVDVYLRELDGSDAASLIELGTALGINERSRREITDGEYWSRIHALVWLALLRDAPERGLLETHCTDTARERAAAARVLYAAETDDCASTGVDLLLRDDPGPFSVFGVDTLHRVATVDPAPFFERAAADFDEWEPALQQQVLLVVRHLDTVVGSADLAWVIDALSSPAPRVRATAWEALGAYGWNPRLRSAVDLAAIGDDPDPAVRASAYRMLGVWGDGDALSALDAAATTEPNDRARVTVAETLVAQRTPEPRWADSSRADLSADTAPAAPGDRADFGVDGRSAERQDAERTEEFAAAWAWAVEHARFDRLARDISLDREAIHGEMRR